MDIDGENPIIQRLKQYIATTGLSSTQFADRACIPRPTFSQMLNGRNKSINNQVLSKLNDNFPNLNILWLLFGQGDMRLHTNIETSEPQNGVIFDDETVENTENQTDIVCEFANRGVSEPMANRVQTQRTAADEVKSGIWRASVLCSPPETDDKGGDGPTKTIPVDTNKRITSIIVLYSDNSFETFNPA